MDDEEKALKLETMPVSCRKNYNELMVTLQRKFGYKHKQELRRTQRTNESVQAFVMLADRLVQLTYLGENHQLLGNFKNNKFVNGIRDRGINLVVCFAE